MSKKEEELRLQQEQEQQEIRRTRIPRDREVLGVCEQRLGGSRMKVRCMDGKTRVCRIPGRLKRNLWVREGDILLIEKWEFSGDDKGDVVFKYRPIQVKFLKEKGYLKLDTFDEF
jgi:translation initiation factor 1A